MGKIVLSILAQLIGWGVIIWILIGWAHGCTSSLPVATRSTGTVLEVSGELVLVTFAVVNRRHVDQGSNWFYIPGHSYRERDLYPDCRKDPELPCPN